MASSICTRSKRSLSVELLTGVEANRRNRSKPDTIATLWARKIPESSNLRENKFRHIAYTMLWPKESYLQAEARWFGHFLNYAKILGGHSTLIHKEIINSAEGAMYSSIVRYKEDDHRTASVMQCKDSKVVAGYLSSNNVCISTAVIDLRYYMKHYTLPLAVLIGEGESRTRYPHCTCLVFRINNQRWEVISKDCTNIHNMDIRPITKTLLSLLKFEKVYYVPLSRIESEKESVNCVGQGLNAAATVLDGKYHNLLTVGGGTSIWEYSLKKKNFLPNKLSGLDFSLGRLPPSVSVNIIDNAETAKSLQDFRNLVTDMAVILKNELEEERKLEMEKEEKNRFIVESIVDRKTIKSKLHYKVHWKGYPSENDTFEPLENLVEFKKKIMQFDRKYEKSLKGKVRRGRKGKPLTLRDVMPHWF